MTPRRVWIIDDDAAVRAVFERALTEAGYVVAQLEDGLAALGLLRDETPALAILDVDMPRLDGWKTLAELRRRGCSAPVLMVTHVNDVDSRIHGLEAGADDYLGKPCHAAELIARVRALLRRQNGTDASSTLRLGSVTVDFQRRTATRDDAPLKLTRTDFALLELLAAHRGVPVSRAEIIERVWQGSAGSSHALDTHLWRLRRKLGDDEGRWIASVTGIGFVLNAQQG